MLPFLVSELVTFSPITSSATNDTVVARIRTIRILTIKVICTATLFTFFEVFRPSDFPIAIVTGLDLCELKKVFVKKAILVGCISCKTPI